MKHISNYKPNEFSELLNVSVKTLQRWDREGILIAKRTPTDRRYYTYDQYLEYIKVTQNIITFEYYNEEQKNQLIEYANKIGCKQLGDE